MNQDQQINFFKKVLQMIEKYQEIVILGHINPDGDCTGSQMAFFHTLKIKYPNKKIYAPFATNNDLQFLLPHSYIDSFSINQVKQPLFIIFDVNNYQRLPIKIPKQVPQIWIDHHPQLINDLPVYWNDVNSASTCEMVCILMRFLKFPFNSIISNCLLTGIITDSGNFVYPKVNQQTFLSVSWLIKNGAQLSFIQEKLTKKTKKDFKILNLIISSLQFDGHFAFFCLKVFDSQFSNSITSLEEIKKHLSFLNNIENINIYAFFLQLKKDHLIHVSLRSKKINLLPIAQKFNGGGHQNACGVKLNNWKQVLQLKKQLSILSNNE